MRTVFKKSFLKEIKKLKNKSIQNSIAAIIEQVEAAGSFSEIKNLKKLEGFDVYY